MKKFVIAVSGGVDSVVLLDILSRIPEIDLTVAHFDHGIRDDSMVDADFVAELAKKYNLPFETKREELGKNASEEVARDRRYEFLRSVAKKYNAKLVTAHHGDDVIETIAINLLRGTGWRGLAAMDSDIIRPLTNFTKSEIINYAKFNKLDWHEDSTNASDDYLRNRLRHQIVGLDNDSKRQLLGLWAQQKSIKKTIDQEVNKLVGVDQVYSRYFFIHIDDVSAMECLRQIVDARLTRPQLVKALHAIKTTAQHKIYQAGNGIQLNFTSRNFTVELIK
jgi:tRNA(Ile)-lysidine synthetase-like protein